LVRLGSEASTCSVPAMGRTVVGAVAAV